jgi:predicted small secreted protein
MVLLRITGVLIIIVLALISRAFAAEINEKLSIGGVMVGAYQYQDVDDSAGTDNDGDGAFVFQPEISYTPTKKDEIFVKFGFASGNGLNEVSPFVLAPWAATMEDDVKDINGRNRDYLLVAYYKHTFDFGEENTLGLTGGIIDAAEYLDSNAFSNDEYTQFMNEALVNAPNVFLPSYDIGGVVKWGIGRFSITGVIMDVGEDEDNYSFFALGTTYTVDTSLGIGNYRVLIDGTSDDFLDPTGLEKENRFSVILSFDQQFGEIIGGWIRFGTQDDKAEINYESIYSGGINISGSFWGRDEDNTGIGYVYLDGGNLGIDNTQVAEIYTRFVLNEYFSLTLDLQYMKDKYFNGDEMKGFIGGLRLVAEY